MRDILEDSITRLLGDYVTPHLLQDAERGIWCSALWDEITHNGFPGALVSEAKGGSGCSWSEVFPLVAAAGKYTLPLPLPETLLAAWILDQAGLDIPDGPITIADPLVHGPIEATSVDGVWRLSGELGHLPWGNAVTFCVAEVATRDGARIALFSPSDADMQNDRNIAGEARDHLKLAATAALLIAPLPPSLPPNPLRFYGAMLRSAQISGAIERLLEHCLLYASERVQFGKPLSKFQAIQQQIAVLGCESAACFTAAAYAFQTMGSPQEQMAIAAAKARTSEAAGKAAAIAHAVHGAIGFTYEHSLQFATRRLWSWRSEFGSHGWWSQRLGQAICANTSASTLWPAVTEGTLELLQG
ncbi:acyl-CoA dehydrogenase family protein [Pseudomonas agarici]|uniref:acyl-CoA dehydrogenase family protein n=1 Tax=Pseudomonas agarici TaxID=46677 RepID=UPI0002F9FD13|nr:acyl-CoA dehydrogenase family protein [Pseudomonas agarici]NWB90015.1 acyl-CoA dehydrogenase [Pseudomonas agarici]NWC08207.1 acyl-CoA dehydrogenase [Pseudomonas agarici]SEK83950.1 acyl-CoA dehydrogenase [Pseudomonas agarici]